MILSQGTEYALRIAAFLALQDQSKRFNSRVVSQATHIPAHYSSKILRKLVAPGILLAVRGKSGGFVLARAPREIKFRDIFEALDLEPNPKHCVFGLKLCSSRSPCLLHYRWQTISMHFQEWANQNTLADVISDTRSKKLLAKYRRMSALELK